MNFNFIARGKEGVEAYNQFWVAFEEVGHTTDDTRGINTAEGIITKTLLRVFHFTTASTLTSHS